MNILVLGCGTRVKIIEYFARALHEGGRVIAADASPDAPALGFGDACCLVPYASDPGYIDAVLSVCRTHQVTALLSLIDHELSLLARHRRAFAEAGVTVIGSSEMLCERCLDKWAMHEWLLANGYPAAKTYRTLESFEAAHASGEIRFPVIIKPRKGSGSLHVATANTMESARYEFYKQSDMLIQQVFEYQEIGIDCYADMITGKLVSAFSKRKLEMRAGETYRSVSYKDERLFAFLKRFVEESGFRAQVDIDLFDVGGTYYITDVNPRFGGGYPHAHACGADHVGMLIRNLRGYANAPHIGQYEADITMMKYPDVLFKRPGGSKCFYHDKD